MGAVLQSSKYLICAFKQQKSFLHSKKSGLMATKVRVETEVPMAA